MFWRKVIKYAESRHSISYSPWFLTTFFQPRIKDGMFYENSQNITERHFKERRHLLLKLIILYCGIFQKNLGRSCIRVYVWSSPYLYLFITWNKIGLKYLNSSELGTLDNIYSDCWFIRTFFIFFSPKNILKKKYFQFYFVLIYLRYPQDKFYFLRKKKKKKKISQFRSIKFPFLDKV